MEKGQNKRQPAPKFGIFRAISFLVIFVWIIGLFPHSGKGVRLDPGHRYLVLPKESAMARIPAGYFYMGSAQKGVALGQKLCLQDVRPTLKIHRRVCGGHLFQDETPRQRVYVSTFNIDRHEVTQKDYAACIAANVCSLPPNLPKIAAFRKDKAPVVGVSWAEAARFCRWKKKRLPTEAEWEKAARGPYGRIWPWGNKWAKKRCNHGNLNPVTTSFEGDSSDGFPWTAPVGSFLGGRSFYGVAEMAGNVAEWVSDRYTARRPTSQTALINPRGPKLGSYRVVKGGSWYGPRFLTRTASRLSYPPTKRETFIGFRCAR